MVELQSKADMFWVLAALLSSMDGMTMYKEAGPLATQGVGCLVCMKWKKEWFDSKFGSWTKSQAGLVSCLEPWMNISCQQVKWLSRRTVGS